MADSNSSSLDDDRHKDADQWHPSIRLENHVGSNGPFLDVLMANQQEEPNTYIGQHFQTASGDLASSIDEYQQ